MTCAMRSYGAAGDRAPWTRRGRLVPPQTHHPPRDPALLHPHRHLRPSGPGGAGDPPFSCTWTRAPYGTLCAANCVPKESGMRVGIRELREQIKRYVDWTPVPSDGSVSDLIER